MPACGCLKFRRVSKNKYFATKSEYKGTTYDSKFERDYAADLDRRLKAGDIRDVQTHVAIELRVFGKKISTYYADFLVTHKDGTKEVVETKGYFTDYAKLKWKLFEVLYNEEHPEIKISLVKQASRWGRR